MFILKSAHETAIREYVSLCKATMVKYNAMIDKYNNLVSLINDKGGQQFLDGKLCNTGSTFSYDELKTIRILCHPDKHDGNKKAEEITKKLNLILSK